MPYRDVSKTGASHMHENHITSISVVDVEDVDELRLVLTLLIDVLGIVDDVTVNRVVDVEVHVRVELFGAAETLVLVEVGEVDVNLVLEVLGRVEVDVVEVHADAVDDKAVLMLGTVLTVVLNVKAKDAVTAWCESPVRSATECRNSSVSISTSLCGRSAEHATCR
eukprot:6481510-Amphidinium_carterae.1